MPDTDTIAAVATPPGEGAIGIVRVSGPGSRALAHLLFKRPGEDQTLESHRLHYGHIVDPDTRAPVDEVLMTLMHAHRTYTREDILEIQCHSGRAVLERILELVLRHGARPAEPGEFTKRAFLNGRIDLTQAEAVIDVVQAQTEEALAVSSRHLRGGLAEKIESVRAALVDLLARAEVAIDFPEEDVDILSPVESALLLEEEILPGLLGLIASYETGRLLREGVRVVLAGRPNVGKSSLLNRLLQRNRAIVTPYPGTTRDTIEEPINVEGIPMRIVDTAGLRETEDEIERLSLERAFDSVEQADLVLFVLDYAEDIRPEDDAIYGRIRQKPIVLVANKEDLWKGRSTEPLKKRYPGHPLACISALDGTGLKDLKKTIAGVFRHPGAESLGSELLLTRFRHKQALELCTAHLSRAVASLKHGGGLDTLAADLQGALEALGSLIGTVTPDDILDHIFRRFCIGK